MLTDVCALVKSNDAVGFDSFAGGAIGEGRISMEAGDGWVFPRAMDRFPTSDDPALAVGVAAGHPTAIDDFVDVDALVEAGQALEHHAHLRS